MIPLSGARIDPATIPRLRSLLRRAGGMTTGEGARVEGRMIAEKKPSRQEKKSGPFLRSERVRHPRVSGRGR